MTSIPKGFQSGVTRVSDMVRQMFPHSRQRLSPEEGRLAIHLRGNQELYESLLGIIQPRIEARARLPEPSEPLVAKSMIARDRELQWLLSKLHHVYHSPASQPAEEDSEQPA